MFEPSTILIWAFVAFVYYFGGLLLALWRQPDTESFIVANMFWSLIPLTFWLYPFSYGYRSCVRCLWYGEG